MPGSQLTTNFIRIATEGKTVDGRDISAQWLIDMAESYAPSVYTAMIWPEHERWWGSCGEVQELKAEEEDGLMRLYARLCPELDLLQANRNGQLLFCSIEPTEDLNFRDTGKPYLEGLGVTSSPASIGTERLRFSAKKNHKLYGALEPLVISDVAELKEDSAMSGKETTKKSLFRQLFSIPERTPPKPEKHFSTKGRKFSDEDIQTLAETVADLQDTVEEQAETIAELQQEQTDVEAIKTVVEEVKEEIEEIKGEVSGGEFSKLKAWAKTADKKFSKLDAAASRLPDEAPGATANKKYAF